MHRSDNGEEMHLNRILLLFLVLFISIVSVFITGCVINHRDTNSTGSSALTSREVSVIPTSFQGNLPENAFIRQSETIIQKFTDIPDKNMIFKGITNESYADLYEFSSVNSSFLVNNVTGRVQSALWYETGSKTQKEIIDLDQGSAIAEGFAKEKYLELWNVTDNKRINQTIKKVIDRGSDRLFEYSWQEFLDNSNENTDFLSEISGINSVSITISPYTGHIISYHEWYKQSEHIPNLTPTLTEEQAWIYAKSFFQITGITDIQPIEIISKKLSIVTDNEGNQCLTWNFEVMRKNKQGFDEGGVVGIDAHDGHVVWHASIL